MGLIIKGTKRSGYIFFVVPERTLSTAQSNPPRPALLPLTARAVQDFQLLAHEAHD
jgi:hypothetical protein